MSKSLDKKKGKKEAKSEKSESDSEQEQQEKNPKNLKRKGIEVKDDEIQFELNKRKKVCVRKFKSNILIDIREYFEKNGELLPTKKGVSLTKDTWEKLKEYIKDIDEAVENI